jgi:alpha-galactosidase
LRLLIIFITVLLLPTFAQADVSVERRGPIVIVDNGRIKLQIHLDRGTVDYLPVDLSGWIHGAAAGIVLQTSGSRLLTTQYPSHSLVESSLTPLDDGIGKGQQLIVRHSGLDGSPTLEQIFRIYNDRPVVLIELRAVASETIQSNWIAPLIVDRKNDDAGLGNGQPARDPRLLEVPFDNDDWQRLNARHLDGAGVVSGTSFEFTSIFDLPSDRGWVIGSITHDFWKTGIDFRTGSTSGRLDKIVVYGGIATSDKAGDGRLPQNPAGTHDVCPHGEMAGTTIQSPTIFLGFFSDFRDGLEEFGRESAVNAPPLPWKNGPPFAWMSFGAVPDVRLEDVIGASDFIHAHLQPKGYSDARGRVCIIIDGNHLSAEQLRQAAEHIHGNGQLAGYYLSPFTCWPSSKEDLAHAVDQTGLTFSQIALCDEQGQPIRVKEKAYALDVTHPATLQWIDRQIQQAKQMGYDYFKLDFLSAGAMEGKHHDPEIHSGTQAYNHAMQFIVKAIGPDKFISLSIAPMFPSQYGHSRRVSCDIYSQLTDLHWPPFRHFGSTEYMLSCDTFLWWMAGSVYAFNDPDEMALSKFQRGDQLSETWAKTRIVSSIVCGGNFIDSDAYNDPVAAQRTEQLLTNSRINTIARKGIAFRPVIRALGSRWSQKHDGVDASDIFYRDDSTENEKAVLLAIFNFDSDHPAKKQVPFAQIGLDSSQHFLITDLWTGSAIECNEGVHTWNLAPGEALLVRITADK